MREMKEENKKLNNNKEQKLQHELILINLKVIRIKI